jgi:hypothetical protein
MDGACRFHGDKNTVMDLVGKLLENGNLQVQYGEDTNRVAAEGGNNEGLCPLLSALLNFQSSCSLGFQTGLKQCFNNE